METDSSMRHFLCCFGYLAPSWSSCALSLWFLCFTILTLWLLVQIRERCSSMRIEILYELMSHININVLSKNLWSWYFVFQWSETSMFYYFYPCGKVLEGILTVFNDVYLALWMQIIYIYIYNTMCLILIYFVLLENIYRSCIIFSYNACYYLIHNYIIPTNTNLVWKKGICIRQEKSHAIRQEKRKRCSNNSCSFLCMWVILNYSYNGDIFDRINKLHEETRWIKESEFCADV